VSGNLRSTAGEALRIDAVQGCGLVQLPTYMVGLDIQAGRLVPVLEEFEPPPRPITALFLHRRYLSAKVRAFVDFLQARYQPMPYWEQWAGATRAS
jgi:DNA-binding transcriptional LysR family regulator